MDAFTTGRAFSGHPGGSPCCGFPNGHDRSVAVRVPKVLPFGDVAGPPRGGGAAPLQTPDERASMVTDFAEDFAPRGRARWRACGSRVRREALSPDEGGVGAGGVRALACGGGGRAEREVVVDR